MADLKQITSVDGDSIKVTAVTSGSLRTARLTTGGGSGTSDHTRLSNRDASDQHPISAITGLTSALASKASTSDIPTKTSDLTNNSGFITAAQAAAAAPVQSVNGQTGAVTVSVPTKTSDLANDSGYITDAGVTSFNGSTGAVTYTAPVTSVNGQTGAVSISIPTVPTNVSAFTNDAGYITSASLPTVPTKTSELTNDSGYITLADLPIYNGSVT